MLQKNSKRSNINSKIKEGSGLAAVYLFHCNTLDKGSTDSSPGGGRRKVREGSMNEREVERGEGRKDESKVSEGRMEGREGYLLPISSSQKTKLLSHNYHNHYCMHVSVLDDLGTY